MGGQQGIIIVIVLLTMLFSRGFSLQGLIETITFGLPGLLVGFSFHEFAHAYVAHKLGDPLPKQQGRLTLDIRKHVEPIGLILLLVAGFGWAKPVEVDMRSLKNPKRDMALTAVAGPLMNVIIAIISIIVFYRMPEQWVNAKRVVAAMFSINAGLAVFNMIPIPPLDGSKVLAGFLPRKLYYKFLEFEYNYQMPIFIVLIFLVSSNIFTKPLSALVTYIGMLGVYISNLIPF